MTEYCSSLSVCLIEVRGQNEHGELKEEAAGANGKDKTCPVEQCVDFVPFESENDLCETALAPLSLSVSYSSLFCCLQVLLHQNNISSYVNEDMQ